VRLARGMRQSVTVAIGIALATVGQAQDQPSGPQASRAIAGRVVEYVASGSELHWEPVGGATVVAGPGIWLEVGADGRDIVSGAAPEFVGTTAADGSFTVPLEPGEQWDLIVWHTGYLPALRAGEIGGHNSTSIVSPDFPDFRIEIILTRQDIQMGLRHRSLAREDGKLIFGAVEATPGSTYLDAEHGVLLPIPPGYARLHVDDDYTFLRLAKGRREISIVDLKQEFDARSLRKTLHAPGDFGEVELLDSEETTVDGAWALRREFDSPAGLTVLVYSARADAYYVFILFSPAEEKSEALVDFEDVLSSLCFVGRKPKVPKGFRAYEHPIWGYTAYVPRAWVLVPDDDPAAPVRAADEENGAALTLHARRVDASATAEAVLEQDIADQRADTPSLSGERLLLVDGEQGVDRAYATDGGRVLRVAAVLRDGMAYSFLFDLPDGEGTDEWEDATAVLRTFRLPER